MEDSFSGQRQSSYAQTQPSGLAIWFHHRLPWQGKVVVTLLFVSFLVASSGCLTMAVIAAVGDHNKTRKVARAEKTASRNSMEDIQQKLNAEDFAGLMLNAGVEHSEKVRTLESDLHTARRMFGQIISYKFLKGPIATFDNHGLVQADVEVNAQNGRFKVHVEWEWYYDSLPSKLITFHLMETEPKSAQHR